MTAAPLCPQCLALNVIATLHGPTCVHQEFSGAAWFPPQWTDPKLERERCAWLKKLPERGAFP